MMKKNVKRSCFVFALVLILTMMMPMAALAEKTDANIQYNTYTSERVVSPAASCNHSISTISFHDTYQNFGSNHLHNFYYRHICSDCGYVWDELYNYKWEAHTYQNKPVNVGGSTIIVQQCVCGAVK